MIRLSHTLKIAALAAGLVGASALAGCAPGYDGREGYRNDYRGGYYHNDRTYDRDRYRGKRRWVCDSDGDDCRWTYDRD